MRPLPVCLTLLLHLLLCFYRLRVSISVISEVLGLRKVTPGVQPGWSYRLWTTFRPLKVNDAETVRVFPTFMKSTVTDSNLCSRTKILLTFHTCSVCSQEGVAVQRNTAL